MGAVSLSGGAVSTLYGGLTGPLGITTLGSNLVWIDPNAGPGTGTAILEAPTNGSGPITTLYNAGSPIIDGSGLTTDGSHLFVADEVQGNVFRLNMNGSNVAQLGGSRYGGFFDTEHTNFITQSAGTLYIVDSGKSGVTAPQVVSIPTTGGTFTTLFAVGSLHPPAGIRRGRRHDLRLGRRSGRHLEPPNRWRGSYGLRQRPTVRVAHEHGISRRLSLCGRCTGTERLGPSGRRLPSPNPAALPCSASAASGILAAPGAAAEGENE